MQSAFIVCIFINLRHIIGCFIPFAFTWRYMSCLKPLIFLLSQITFFGFPICWPHSHRINFLVFQSVDLECTWWKLFKKNVVCTKLDIYLLIREQKNTRERCYEHLSVNLTISLWCVPLIKFGSLNWPWPTKILCQFVTRMSCYNSLLLINRHL